MSDHAVTHVVLPVPTTDADDPQTLTELLGGLADRERDAVAFLDFGRDPAGTVRKLSYRALDARARGLARTLRETTAPGERAAVLCPQGLDYAVAFLGCLYAGVVAVPLYAPEPFRSEAGLAAMLADAAPARVLTTSEAAGAVDALGLSTTTLLVDRIGEETTGWRPPPPERDAAAYLQYTSGSTSRPKGVVITHGNLAWCVHQCALAYGVDADTRAVAWLPLFHDMGLIAGLLLPLSRGASAVLMSPMAFVQRPARYLRALSEHRATFTAVPNFALDMCVARTKEEDRAALDLSALRTVVNGSEPVRARSLDRFSEAFAPAGFAPTAHTPSFGMAEATVLVTAKPSGTLPVVLDCDRAALDDGRVVPAGNAPGARRLVGCGVPVEQDVRVVHPDTAEDLGEGRVGEVWVRGPNLGTGYYGRDSAEVFDARLHGTGGWLRTGDAGFLHEGQLFLAGRYKDLIIVDGRNHHPADLEATVESAVPGLRRGHVAAFPTDDGEAESLVVVAEYDPPRPGDAEALRLARRALAVHHGANLSDLRLVRRGRVPRTTSGKIQRALTRSRYLDGTYDA